MAAAQTFAPTPLSDYSGSAPLPPPPPLPVKPILRGHPGRVKFVPGNVLA